MAQNQIDELPDKVAGAAIVALLIVVAVMLLALVTKTPPHPPLTTPFFALGPFLGASLASGGAALLLCLSGHQAWRFAAILFVITALPSFGPQKLLVPELPEIWPAVTIAQISLLTLALRLVSAFRTHGSVAARVAQGQAQ